MKTKMLASYETYPFAKKFILKYFGENLFANINDIIGAEILQEAILAENKCRLDIHLSARLFQVEPVVFEPLFLRTFYFMMVSFVDAQRQLGTKKIIAMQNFLLHHELTENDLPLDTAIKMYDRYKKD